MNENKKTNDIKSEIIPVTNAIRNYIRSEKDMSELESYMASKLNLTLENYKEKRSTKEKELADRCEVISCFSDKDKMFNRQMYLMSEAANTGKSLVWVYQEMVLSGYGYDINTESIIYRAAAIANEDVSLILERNGEFEAIRFESQYVLKGKKYEERLITNETNTNLVSHQKKIVKNN